MRYDYEYITDEFYSNCLIEALKAKLRRPFHVKLYYCKARRKNGKFQCCHFMWSDGKNDFDFTDKDTYNPERFLQHLWYPGMIRKWPHGFAKEYSSKRNHKG